MVRLDRNFGSWMAELVKRKVKKVANGRVLSLAVLVNTTGLTCSTT